MATSADEEGFRDGARYITLGVFAACLIVLFLTIGFGMFGSDAPVTPQPTASPAKTNP
jgi:hypothetical protein